MCRTKDALENIFQDQGCSRQHMLERMLLDNQVFGAEYVVESICVTDFLNMRSLRGRRIQSLRAFRRAWDKRLASWRYGLCQVWCVS